MNIGEYKDRLFFYLRERKEKLLFYLKEWLRPKLERLRNRLGPDEPTQQLLAAEREKVVALRQEIAAARLLLAVQLQRAEKQSGLSGDELKQLMLLVLWEALSRRDWIEWKRVRDELVKWLRIHLSFSPLQVSFLHANGEKERNATEFQQLLEEIEQLIAVLCR